MVLLETSKSRAKNYRPEVDGLRAIAVMAVVLFHAKFQLLAGGYVGVDIFFVISGFLIGNILTAEFSSHRFSILKFYERRVRRIAPALFLILIVTSIVGYFYFLPAEYKSFGQGLVAAALFSSNILLYLKGEDYFGLQSELNPVLHLWSLGVEEQYYLFFPLLLWIFGIKLPKLGKLAFAAIFSGSIIYSYYAYNHNFPAAFYLLPARAWELLIGLYAIKLHKQSNKLGLGARESLSWVGLLIIFIAIFYSVHEPSQQFWFVMLACIGSALFLAFSDGTKYAKATIGSAPLVGIGLISYSLYLWHQPIFVLYRLATLGNESALGYVLAVVLCIVLAALSWRFIEEPFRDKKIVTKKTLVVAFAAFSFAIIAFGAINNAKAGFPGRNDLFARLDINNGLSEKCNGNVKLIEECRTKASPEVVVWGNSFAMHLVDGLKLKYAKEGIGQITKAGCELTTINDLKAAGRGECAQFVERSLDEIVSLQSVHRVIISSPFVELLNNQKSNNFELLVQRIKRSGKSVVIVGPTPQNGVDFGRCFAVNNNKPSLCNFSVAKIRAYHQSIIDDLRYISLRNNVQFVDLSPYVCSSTTCRVYQTDTMIYRDDRHLSHEGSRYVFSMINIVKNM